MKAVDVQGKFVWHQLMTRDIPRAAEFYSRLTGWDMQPWPPDPNYMVCHTQVGPAAGIMAIPAESPDVPPHWLQYIGTRDVDGTAEAAVRAGGSVLKAPSELRGAGRYAVLKDPDGAVFAIIDPENARPELPGAAPLGTFSWHELATTDNEGAFAFYNQLFGWEAITRMDLGPIGTYLIFGWNGEQRGGMYVKPADSPLAPQWLPYLSLASADEGLALAVSNGAQAMFGPMDVPGGSRVAMFMDPAGAPFAVHSMKGASSVPPSAATKVAGTSRSKPKAKVATRPKRAAAKRKPTRKAVAKRKRVPKKASRAAANKPRAKQSKMKLKSKSRPKRGRRKK